MTRGDLTTIAVLALAGASGLALWSLVGARIWTGMAFGFCL
jgi:hypothetical protein